MSDLHASFNRELRAEGRSPATLRLYGQSIRFYSEWLERQGRAATLDELTRSGIRAWLAELADSLEPATVRTRYRGMRRFCQWLVDEEEIPANPMEKLSPPSPRAKPVPVLSDDDLGALLRACTGREFNDRRDEAMIRMLLDCGVRVGELCGLGLDDLDLDAGSAIVTGKGVEAARGLLRRSDGPRPRSLPADARVAPVGERSGAVPHSTRTHEPRRRPESG